MGGKIGFTECLSHTYFREIFLLIPLPLISKFSERRDSAEKCRQGSQPPLLMSEMFPIGLPAGGVVIGGNGPLKSGD